MTSFIGFIVVIIVLSILTGMLQGTKKKRGSSTGKRKPAVKKSNKNNVKTTLTVLQQRADLTMYFKNTFGQNQWC